ncbi:MAG: apolipoprotein N-acyltransferase, partial [Planctomycetes bacterium]|nr:apolipoprotein N-acyltransferase [Planctomycetota bacterium]
VALEYFRGWCISGLPWVYVGHTQYENLVLIQTADLVGAYGPSFLCLMTSGLVADVLTRPLYLAAPRAAGEAAPGQATRLSRALVAMAALTVAAWVFTVAYGLWRLNQDAARPGPFVASVQTCVPQEVKLKARNEQIEQLEEQLMGDQLALTDEAAAAARQAGETVDLVVWPETMVPGILNRAFLEDDLAARLSDEPMREVFEYLQRRSRLYWTLIQQKAAAVGAPILFGAHGVAFEGAVRLPGGGYLTRGPRYNMAYLVSPGSKPYAADHSYAKAHLVPFGEYVPFKESWPWLHEALQGFTPYSYDYSLTPGAHDQEPFVLRYGGEEARFQVAICYEDAIAYRVREMAACATPRLDFVVNISNDGWFVRGWLGEDGTYELDQHLNLGVFRAVENRVAIVRSVNTGISALVSPTGRIEKIVTDAAGRFRNVAGQVTGRLTLDTRRAPYTDVGDLFARLCLLATLAAGAGGAVWRRLARPAPGKPGG